jgi:hypothetical protein
MRTVDRKNNSFTVRFMSYLTVGAASVALLPSLCQAMSYQDYKDALKIVQAKIDRTRSANSASALSSPIIKAYFGRYYRVGDAWDVASWELKNPMMSLTPVSENTTVKTGRGGIFHYEVKDVRNGASPQVVISVRQISEFGMGPVDPKVQELTLTMSDRFVQTEKAYRIKGKAKPIQVSPNGIHTDISPLELFALDVPEIASAVKHTPSSMPELPAAAQTVATQAGYHPDLSQSTWLDQDDFFGRSVEILWQYGNPWPAYLKTSTSLSILLRSNANGRAS